MSPIRHLHLTHHTSLIPTDQALIIVNNPSPSNTVAKFVSHNKQTKVPRITGPFRCDFHRHTHTHKTYFSWLLFSCPHSWIMFDLTCSSEKWEISLVHWAGPNESTIATICIPVGFDDIKMWEERMKAMFVSLTWILHVANFHTHDSDAIDQTKDRNM